MKGIYYVKRRGQQGMTNVTHSRLYHQGMKILAHTTQYKFIHIILHTGDSEKVHTLLMMGLIETIYQHLMQLLLAMKLMTTKINN